VDLEAPSEEEYSNEMSIEDYMSFQTAKQNILSLETKEVSC